MQLFKKPNFNFMKYKFIALAISGFIITIGIINITGVKGINYGIDFAGGTLLQIRFKDSIPIAELRESMRNANLGNSKIQEVEKGEKEFIIRTMLPEKDADQELEAHVIMGNKVVEVLKSSEDKIATQQGLADLNNIDKDELAYILESFSPDNAKELAEKIIDLRESTKLKAIIENFNQITDENIDSETIKFLKEKTFLGSLSIKRRETVGPQVGHDLRTKAAQATIWALIGMLIYIGLRFKFAYGVSAILTLTHDVLVTLGIFSLTNRELNLPVIAAILTIVGYSLNDTIVIFDRVRDNLKILRKHHFEEILNVSINQTLSRTIITSVTTFITVASLFLFGGEVINDFAFTMIIGVIVGTYSSIYQSCSLLHFWKIIFKPKKGLGK